MGEEKWYWNHLFLFFYTFTHYYYNYYNYNYYNNHHYFLHLPTSTTTTTTTTLHQHIHTHPPILPHIESQNRISLYILLVACLHTQHIQNFDLIPPPPLTTYYILSHPYIHNWLASTAPISLFSTSILTSKLLFLTPNKDPAFFFSFFLYRPRSIAPFLLVHSFSFGQLPPVSLFLSFPQFRWNLHQTAASSSFNPSYIPSLSKRPRTRTSQPAF